MWKVIFLKNSKLSYLLIIKPHHFYCFLFWDCRLLNFCVLGRVKNNTLFVISSWICPLTWCYLLYHFTLWKSNLVVIVTFFLSWLSCQPRHLTQKSLFLKVLLVQVYPYYVKLFNCIFNFYEEIIYNWLHNTSMSRESPNWYYLGYQPIVPVTLSLNSCHSDKLLLFHFTDYTSTSYS